MIVGRIGHASLVVQTAETACLMDPVFNERFECGTNALDPPVAVDHEALAGRYRAIVISHEHMDHFSVRTLARLERGLPVIFPRGAKLIQLALERLGFLDRRPVAPGESVRVGNLDLTATPSNVSFPEIGILFRSGGRSFWNPVDSTLNEKAQVLVKRLAPQLDFMLAYYQPLIELPLMQDALGAEFPYQRYGQLLADVCDAGPRCVAPGSCGFRYSLNDWQNDRGFPMTEAQFLADLGRLQPGLETRLVPHGAAIEVADGFTVHENVMEYARPGRAVVPEGYDWRPYRAVPEVVDCNPFASPPVALREQVRRYLDGEFLAGVSAPENAVWARRMADLEVVWQLELVYPDGERETRYLAFGARQAGWVPNSGGRLPKIMSCVPASTILGLLAGDYNSYSANLTRRVAVRLYQAHRWGVVQAGSAADEPLARVLFPGADRRCVERDLARLGYGQARQAVRESTAAVACT